MQRPGGESTRAAERSEICPISLPGQPDGNTKRGSGSIRGWMVKGLAGRVEEFGFHSEALVNSEPRKELNRIVW